MEKYLNIYQLEDPEGETIMISENFNHILNYLTNPPVDIDNCYHTLLVNVWNRGQEVKTKEYYLTGYYKTNEEE